MKRFCRIAFFILIIEPPAIGQPDAFTLIRQSVANYEQAWRAGMQWGYTQKDVTADDGKRVVEVSEVIPIEGTPYDRLVSKDGKPLPPEEQRKEDRKYESEFRKRHEESPVEREARVRKYEKQREFVNEIPEAYDFKILGEENVGDRPAWVIALTPKDGYVPVSTHAELLKHIDGKLWIDKQDLQWAKAEAHVIDTISIGLILARIGPGARITLDMSRISPGLWMPKEITINGEARVLLVHNKILDEQLEFTGYHLGPMKPPATQVAHAIGQSVPPPH